MITNKLSRYFNHPPSLLSCHCVSALHLACVLYFSERKKKVRNYKRKSDQQNWSEEAMKLAVSKVRAKEMTLGHAADVYADPKTTLFRRVRKDGHLDEVTRKGLGR